MKFEDLFKLILILIGSGILIINIWNLFTLKYLSKTRAFKDTQLNDSKYFELKYKYEFMIAIFTMIVAVVSFIGYNSYNTLRDNLTSGMKLQIDSTIKSIAEQKRIINTISEEINSQSKKVISSSELIKMIEREQKKLTSQINIDQSSVKNFNNNIVSLKERISNLQNKNIIKQELYIIKDLIYPLALDWQPKIFYFKDLKTVNNENLPNFKDNPIIIPFTNDGISYVVSHVSNTSFQITAIGNSQLISLPNDGKFSLLISVIN